MEAERLRGPRASLWYRVSLGKTKVGEARGLHGRGGGLRGLWCGGTKMLLLTIPGQVNKPLTNTILSLPMILRSRCGQVFMSKSWSCPSVGSQGRGHLFLRQAPAHTIAQLIDHLHLETDLLRRRRKMLKLSRFRDDMT